MLNCEEMRQKSTLSSLSIKTLSTRFISFVPRHLIIILSHFIISFFQIKVKFSIHFLSLDFFLSFQMKIIGFNFLRKKSQSHSGYSPKISLPVPHFFWGTNAAGISPLAALPQKSLSLYSIFFEVMPP